MVCTRSNRKVLRDEAAKLEVLYRLLNESVSSKTLLKYILIYLAPQGGQQRLMDILFDKPKEEDEEASQEEFDVEAMLDSGMNLDFSSALEAIEEMEKAKADNEEKDETVSQLFSLGED